MQPNYEDQDELEAVLQEIANRPPLVFAGEAGPSRRSSPTPPRATRSSSLAAILRRVV